jgi:hypothetical protein
LPQQSQNDFSLEVEHKKDDEFIAYYYNVTMRSFSYQESSYTSLRLVFKVLAVITMNPYFLQVVEGIDL